MISHRFRFDRVDHSFRCTEMEAAPGLAQLEDWEAIVRGSKRVAHFYTTHLSVKPGIEQHLQWPRGDEHVYMIDPLVVKDAKHKQPLTQYLEERGIETRDLLPLLGRPVYRRMFGDLLDRCPAAKMFETCGFYIGLCLCGSDLGDRVRGIAPSLHDSVDGLLGWPTRSIQVPTRGREDRETIPGYSQHPLS